MGWEMDKYHSFVYRYYFPEPFAGKTILSPVNGLVILAKNQLTILLHFYKKKFIAFESTEKSYLKIFS